MATPATLRRISEQAVLILTGGSLLGNYNELLERAKLHAASQINYMLRIEQFETRALGENIASVDAAIANYTILDADITVDGKYAKLSLPIRPMSLPHGQGVWGIILKHDASGKEGELLPIPAGMYRNFIVTYPSFETKKKFNPELVESFWGYYTHLDGMTIRLSSSAFASGYSANLQLLVVDVSKIDEDDLLPIPADMVNPIIDYVVNQMSKDKPVADKTENQTKNA